MILRSEDSEIRELRQRVAELTKAVEARDAFIAIAADELRNPMTPVVGYVELLLSRAREGRLSAGQAEQGLSRVHGIVRHYMKRAEVLHDVSQIVSGKLRLEPEPFDLAVLLRDVAGQFADAARRMGAPIKVVVPDSLPGAWDRPAVERVIDNLVSNALKHAARAPVELTAEADGERVRIQVRDHGAGLSAHDWKRACGRFERAVGEGERRSGFGVGLWLVHQLTGAMGGTVAIEDAPGAGALFTVTLPRHAKGTCV